MYLLGFLSTMDGESRLKKGLQIVYAEIEWFEASLRTLCRKKISVVWETRRRATLIVFTTTG